MTEDGTHVRSLAESLDVRGTMSWSPDGKWVVVAAEVERGGRLFKIPVDGGEPLRITDQPSSNPSGHQMGGSSHITSLLEDLYCR